MRVPLISLRINDNNVHNAGCKARTCNVLTLGRGCGCDPGWSLWRRCFLLRLRRLAVVLPLPNAGDVWRRVVCDQLAGRRRGVVGCNVRLGRPRDSRVLR